KRLHELGIEELGEEVAAATHVSQGGLRLVLTRPWVRWRMRRRLARLLGRLDPARRAHAKKLHQLLAERQRLDMEINQVETARRLLALWHVFHIPLSFALFTMAFAHIGGALYYAAFLR